MSSSHSRSATVQRTPSMVEFQEMMKNDATSALQFELKQLRQTANEKIQEVCVYLLNCHI